MANAKKQEDHSLVVDWGHSIIAKEFELALLTCTTTRVRVQGGTCGLGIGFRETLEVGGEGWRRGRLGR